MLLTHAEILVMPAGYEINKLIAKKVMGWALVGNHGAADGMFWIGHRGSFDDMPEHNLPDFSGEIDAAWEIDKPEWRWDFSESDLGLYVNLYTHGFGVDDGVQATVAWESVGGDKSKAYCLGRCRAALLSVLE
jgi:hypothetical protein